jgi:hypothetical protein
MNTVSVPRTNPLRNVSDADQTTISEATGDRCSGSGGLGTAIALDRKSKVATMRLIIIG